MEFGDGDIDRFLVWVHDREILAWVGVGRGASGCAIEVLVRNAPRWHGFELVSEESGDVVHGEVGFKSAI